MSERPTPPDPETFKILHIRKEEAIDEKNRLENKIKKIQIEINLIQNPPNNKSNKFIKIIGIGLFIGFIFLIFKDGEVDLLFLLSPLHWFLYATIIGAYFTFVAFLEKKANEVSSNLSSKPDRTSEIETHKNELQKNESNLKVCITVINRFKKYEKALSDYQKELAIWNQTQNQFWKKIKGVELENSVKDILENKKWTVSTTKTVGDAGIDLICERNGKRVLIQCKGEARPLGVGAVRDAAGVNAIEKPDLMVVVAPNGFTSGSIDVASKAGLKLLTSTDLVDISISEADILH